MLNYFKKFENLETLFIAVLIGFVIGVGASSTVSYPIKVDNIEKIHSFCQADKNDKVISIRVNYDGLIKQVTCESGLSFKLN